MKLYNQEPDSRFYRRIFLKKLSLFAIVIGLSKWIFGIVSMTTVANALENEKMNKKNLAEKIIKSEDEWRRILTPEQFRIMRKKGTERPFSGKYNNYKGNGVYQCAGCGLNLFSSETKFDSGTGWPSFWAPITKENVLEEADYSLFMKRTEVLCNRCDAHLGHIFEDGPQPTGLRYCINSVSLKFVENGEKP